MSVNALFSRYGGCDATLEISHTVATLDARAKFAELRRIVRVMGEHDERWLNEANSHIDSLVEFLTDTLHAMDGMVEGDRFINLQEEHDDTTDALEAAQAD